MTEPVDGTKAYLEYLDKEMTIMGILSRCCVAAAALVVDRVGSAEHESFFGGLAKSHIVQVLIGSCLLMLAGLYFYLQRSTLAFFYGSICMSIAKRAGNKSDSERWLIEVDSWATWLRYRLGFMFLTLAAVFFMFLAFQTICPARGINRATAYPLQKKLNQNVSGTDSSTPIQNAVQFQSLQGTKSTRDGFGDGLLNPHPGATRRHVTYSRSVPFGCIDMLSAHDSPLRFRVDASCLRRKQMEWVEAA
jgi:hypothetical protein